MTRLNETQSAAVCQAYCAMLDLQDAADRLQVKAIIIMDTDGSLFAAPNDSRINYKMNSCSKFLRSVKDRTPKEIEDFKNNWIEAVRLARESSKESRIAELKAELEALTENA